MDREQLDKRLDEWLDQAAADFGRAKARPGLEARTVARLHSRLRPRPWWRRWQIVTAAAGAAFIFLMSVFLVRFHDRRAQSIVFQDKRGETAGPNPDVGSVPALARQPSERIAGSPGSRNAGKSRTSTPEIARTRLPRQDTFPSAGLSDQERLLLAYARFASEGGIAGLADENAARPIEVLKLEIPLLEIPKLEIAPIKIEPLPVETGDPRK